MHLRTFAITIAIGLSGCATLDPNRTPAVVEGFARRNNVEIVKSFELAPSIRGYAIENVKGGKGIIYVVDGKYGFVGNMLGADGQALTKTHLQAHVYDLAGAYARLQNEATPITSDPDATIYGFYEPQCNYCVQAIDELAQAGVNVKWVPVLFFGETSINALAAVYAATDEQAALVSAAAAQRQHKLGEWVSGQTYGTDNLRTAVDATALHESIMKQAGISGTPTFLAKVGGQVLPLTTSDLLEMRAEYLARHAAETTPEAATPALSPTTSALSPARPPLTSAQVNAIIQAIHPALPADDSAADR